MLLLQQELFVQNLGEASKVILEMLKKIRANPFNPLHPRSMQDFLITYQ